MTAIRYTRNLFLRGMSIVYLFAFTSLYIQIPGLYGSNGILPARTQLDSKAATLTARIHNKPTLLWLAPYVGLDTEYMMDVLALFGAFLAFTGLISQKFCTAPMFAGLWSLYYSLYQVGQTFMWFQWDLLLLEAGFLCILVAPLRYRAVSRRRPTPLPPSDPIAFWLVRWLLFRLMFSSGIVKLTSACPTWWNLSALSIHFQSQCIPTPLAWYSHHLPEWILKLSTVSANVIEIGVPFLFFFPLRGVRITAFYLEVFLQICIILTGNYNFFNILTIVLCISLLDDDFFLKKKQTKGGKLWLSVLKKGITIAVYGGVLYAAYTFFNLRLESGSIISDVAFTKQEFDQALAKTVPISVYIALGSLVLLIIQSLSSSFIDSTGSFSKFSTVTSTLFYSAAAVSIFGLSIVPYSHLHPAANSTVVPAFRTWHTRLDHLHLTNSYGLFRRMTGVDGRPEVILEGSNHIDGPWKEYNFLYKPGNVNSTPPFVAPHQPRLDWQMWFASLGTYHQNPWLMGLTYRLLNGQPEVLQLLDSAKNPFPNKPPKYIKASLYRYHYTTWNQRWSEAWWAREKQSEYLPIFSRDHPPLLEYLRKLRIVSDEIKEQPVTPWLKYVLDHLRYLFSQIEPSILLWSIFSAGCVINLTSGSGRK